MCELMGMSFARPLSAAFSIRSFVLSDEENADGWGLAWYPDQSLSIVKEPVRWSLSPYATFLERYQRVRSRIYLAHIRHRTIGGAPTHADTHPFSREMEGAEFSFAHNGTIADAFTRLPLGRYRPIGGTDSEHVFCHLLAEIGSRERLTNEAGWRWLWRRLSEINRGGKLNCLLSDGQRLFCYHDANGWKGLAFRHVRLPMQQSRHLEDPTMEVDLESDSTNHGWVVATRPLSESGWHHFEGGELIVFDHGLWRYSSHRAAPSSTGTLSRAAAPRASG